MYIYTHGAQQVAALRARNYFQLKGFIQETDWSVYHRCTQYLSGLCFKSSKHLFITRSKDF